jgi:protein involved in polysaccharide export with SLBB domain
MRRLGLSGTNEPTRLNRRYGTQVLIGQKDRVMTTGRRIIAAALCCLFLSAVTDMPLFAQQVFSEADYRVGVGDRIFLSVPQRPDLNRELVILEGGVVKLPLIGDVPVAGLTLEEIDEKLLTAIKDYYPSINEIEITIREAVSQVVYITGQVNNAGKFNFYSSPNLWEAIREAGGPTPTAALDNVRVVKDRSKGGQSTVYNVQNALETGSVTDLPMLEAGDTVIVPAAAETYTGSFGVNVFGSVVAPGTYKLQARQDLITAILQAGGPSEIASLDRVNIVRPNSDGSISTLTVDFGRFLDKGDPFSNPKLKPGDTVFVPQKSRGKQLADADIALLLTLVTTTLTVVLLAITLDDRINRDQNN